MSAFDSRRPGDQAPVLISLSSFGAAEVRRHGQAWFAQLSAQADADGVEVRGELLDGSERELDSLVAVLEQQTLQRVYSHPDGLWHEDGQLNQAALERAVHLAQRLHAPRFKMSIGGFDPHSGTASLSRLAQVLAGAGSALVIENDQTAAAGTVRAMRRFFAATDAAGLELGMTFDLGNWHWQGECPLAAARAFATRVCYVHCKGVQIPSHKWVAVPLEQSLAPWRTVLGELPANLPWAIEYPLMGDDLLAVTRERIAALRRIRQELR